MALAGRTRRAVGEAVRWERRTIGATTLIPPQVRSRLRRMLGMGAIQEARRFAPADGLESLFETLHRKNACYVVIRWFDTLPFEVANDIDFLIGDESLSLFESLLRASKGVPCDLYSASGVEGYRYAGMPYFPPLLARRILARRTIAAGCISVPSPEDHFFSLAYHAIYQKGLRSGLSTLVSSVRPIDHPAHDYWGRLRSLARELQIPVDLSMEGLDRLLVSRGWRPPEGMLRRLAPQNEWIREYFFKGSRAFRSLDGHNKLTDA